MTPVADPSASVDKPLLRGVSHQIAFFVAAVAAFVLVREAPSPTTKWACGIYGASLAVLFGVSALYHRPTWSAPARAWMRRLDHSAIFVLIAGTYTPLCMALEPSSQRFLLVIVWVGALLGALRALFWVNAPKVLVGLLALAMGWIAVGYLPALYRALGLGLLAWIVAGGALYSIGAVIYMLRRPDPWPRVFGYHEIFHALVIAAAVCHFIAVFAMLGTLPTG